MTAAKYSQTWAFCTVCARQFQIKKASEIAIRSDLKYIYIHIVRQIVMTAAIAQLGERQVRVVLSTVVRSTNSSQTEVNFGNRGLNLEAERSNRSRRTQDSFFSFLSQMLIDKHYPS